MIYDYLKTTDPIRQGDIFIKLPSLRNIDLDILVIDDENGNPIDSSWKKIQNEPVIQTKVTIEPVIGIIASQDCDVTRNDLISFFEVIPLKVILPTPSKKPEKYFPAILDTPNAQSKWFYLPIDKKLGFDEKMAVDFEHMFQIPRKGLENNKDLRKGRLNSYAIEHYRKNIANYFTRYAYNKWYPLTKAELRSYNSLQSDGEKAQPFSWQK